MGRDNAKPEAAKACYWIVVATGFYLAYSRAAEMYITVDEAMTYIDHVLPKNGLLDFSAANNHFFNTVLVKGLTFLSPYNELSIRLPSLLIGIWFFAWYLPKRIENSFFLLTTAILCLTPLYISEYWSMSRGYFMSGCFASATLLEISTDNREENQGNTYAALTTLSSFAMLPFAFAANMCLVLRSGPSWASRVRACCLRWSFWVLQASLLFSYFAIRTFQTSGEALSKANAMTALSPFEAILNSPVSGNTYSARLAALVFLAASIFTLAKLGWHLKSTILIIAGSLMLLLISGAITGGYPDGRSWIPYWFPFCTVIGNLATTGTWQRSRLTNYSSYLVTAAYIAITTSSFTPHYVNYWRSNDYQVKALMYHSAKGDIQCLEERDKGDKVLMFYWDDPKSAVSQPRTCVDGEHSPYGFSNFEVPAKKFDFPRKIYGQYDQSIHTGWYVDTVIAPKKE